MAAVSSAGVSTTSDPDAGMVLIGVQTTDIADPGPGDLLGMASLGRIIDMRLNKAGEPVGVVVQALCRARLETFEHCESHLVAHVNPLEEAWPANSAAEGTRRALRAAVREGTALFGGPERARAILRVPLPTPLWIDLLAVSFESPVEWRKELLLETDALARAESVLEGIARGREVAEAQRAVEERMSGELREAQKEAALRQQLKAIQAELGEDQGDLEEIRARLAERDLPDEVTRVVNRELGRLERLRSSSPERSVAMDWLDWVASLPWNEPTAATDLSLPEIEERLANSHHGLEDIKRQVVEHLAVRQLAGSGRADVLLLVGPPGVGKTSVAQAIAEATGRRLVRVALGGVRDEAELRGHRRTYVGARPGRLIEGFRRAEACDPVVLLDEIDKVGAGWRGDPTAALLEILDPEQNHAFTDHYLEVPFDLSSALFIATANDLGRIPAPLRDRMEILRIEGYTPAEKQAIVRAHLLPRLARNAGVAESDVEITDEALTEIISGWTREAGVRGLQRTIGRIYRAAAVHRARGELDAPLTVEHGDLVALLGRRRFEQTPFEPERRPGIATGLAWTPVGGDVLTVEAAALPGSGRLVLTGQLGDVMKESARAALTYVLSEHDALEIAPDAARDRDIHVHVPAGAVPKDGPSAGVTMFTALASLLSGRTVRADVAMTGEATLRGRVLPVGGIKSKVLAAHRHGMRRVILPQRNAGDLDELPEAVREEMTFIPVDHMSQVLAEALAPREEVVMEQVA